MHNVNKNQINKLLKENPTIFGSDRDGKDDKINDLRSALEDMLIEMDNVLMYAGSLAKDVRDEIAKLEKKYEDVHDLPSDPEELEAYVSDHQWMEHANCSCLEIEWARKDFHAQID